MRLNKDKLIELYINQNLSVYEICTILNCDRDSVYYSLSVYQIQRSREKSKEAQRQYCLKTYGVEHYSQTKEWKEKMVQTMQEKYGVSNPSQVKEFEEKKKQTLREHYGDENYWHSANSRALAKQTMLEKYGAENASQIKEFQEKKKQALKEHYGDENYLYSDECRNKIRQTNLETYGYENPMQSPEIRKRAEQTNLERYGTRNPMSNPEIYNKTKDTMRQKYGVSNAFGSPELREKSRQTMIERYGTDHPWGNAEIKQRVENTMYERYGVTHPGHMNDHGKKIRTKWLTKRLHKLGFDQETASNMACNFYDDEYVRNYLKSHNLTELMREYLVDKEEIRMRCQQLHIKIPSKFKAMARSYGESICRGILTDLGIEYITEMTFQECRDINPLLFDFYLPKYNACIEYDGEQHTRPVERFGGETYFQEIQKHDQMKNIFCESHSIPLLRIPYTETDIKGCILNFLQNLEGNQL